MNFLITAGPTREPIDAVRFISNRSSGKMGYAIADAAAGRGHTVRLISGPVALSQPDNVEVIGVNTAAEMLEAVKNSFSWCDVLIMAAAVADWRPKQVAQGKLKKTTMSDCLQLERTTDILLEIALLKKDQIIVGFAAETNDLIKEGQRKLAEKKLDLVVANDVSQPDAGFEVETTRVTLISNENVENLPLMTKAEAASYILKHVRKLSTK